MRLIILSLLIALWVQAKEATCYTVQLLSTVNNETNSKKISALEYADECKVMNIGNSITLRCGCYEHINPAKEKLNLYKKKYKYAYVATTYAYRFGKEKFSAPKAIQKKEVNESPRESIEEPVLSIKEESLKLMLQSFLYSSDLKNAYRTARIGVKKYPQHYYWTQKMAEISEWTGREDEALKYMLIMNKQNSTAKLENKLIKKGFASYQYEKIVKIVEKQAREFPSKRHSKQVVYVHSQIGTPEKAALFFEKEYKTDRTNLDALTEALQIYMEMGDLEKAKKIVKTIENRKLYSLENSKLIAYYYYQKHKMKKAYHVLALMNKNKSDKKYYELKSDLGWYLKKYKLAANASQKLIKTDEGRLVDYERVMFTAKGVDEKLALKTALASYNKFQESHLFYTYAYTAMDQNKYEALRVLIQKIDSDESALAYEPTYWLIKSNIYSYFNEKKKASMAIEKALELDPLKLQTQLAAISMYIEYGESGKLKLALINLSENSMLPVAFYYPLASAYYQLQDINRASFYLDKLLELKAPISKSIGFKFLQADVYAQRNNDNAFKSTLYEINEMLEKQERENPAIVSTNSFQNLYLRVNLHIMNPDEFEKKLQAAKAVLTQGQYNDLSYAWANKHHAYEKAYLIYKRTKPKAIWLQFANAMQEQNHSEIENLLLKYLSSLSMSDASNASYKDGQIALSQSLAYDALAKNDDNQNAYIRHLGLVQERSNHFNSKVSYYSRDPLLSKYVELMNQMYLSNGYIFGTGINYYQNSSLNDSLLFNVPSDTLEFNLALKKLFDKGELGAKIGYTNSMTSFATLGVFVEYQVNKLIRLYGSFDKNKKADETTQLLLGGKKDMLSLSAKLDIMASTSVNFLWQSNRFSSQDGVHIGAGNYGRVLLGHQIHNGYPDMRIGIFGDYGKYSEKSGSKGTVDQLQVPGTAVLPKEFYNLGLDFAYGMANGNIYTRVWRPFIQVNTFYNSEIGNFSYNFNLGYGGKVFSQDHMVVGANYAESVNGVGGTVFELFLRYQFLYMNQKMLNSFK